MLEGIEGGLFGVHAGDSLGATHEFQPWASIHRPDNPEWRLRSIIGGGTFNWKPGDTTDDTDLTVAVLRAYVRPEGFDLVIAADNMLAWSRRSPALGRDHAPRVGWRRPSPRAASWTWRRWPTTVGTRSAGAAG